MARKIERHNAPSFLGSK